MSGLMGEAERDLGIAERDVTQFVGSHMMLTVFIAVVVSGAVTFLGLALTYSAFTAPHQQAAPTILPSSPGGNAAAVNASNGRSNAEIFISVSDYSYANLHVKLYGNGYNSIVPLDVYMYPYEYQPAAAMNYSSQVNGTTWILGFPYPALPYFFQRATVAFGGLVPYEAYHVSIIGTAGYQCVGGTCPAYASNTVPANVIYNYTVMAGPAGSTTNIVVPIFP